MDSFSGDYISWLKTFYNLANLRSFSRAAAAIDKSQSTITYQLKKLEDRLGVELINRRVTPLELTPSGRQLYKLCQQLFGLLNKINEQINENHEIQGNIIIAANYGITTYYLPPRILEFKKIYSNVDIEVRPQPIKDLLKSYYDPEVDLLITQKSILPEESQVYPLFSADMALVTPADWDISISNPPRIEEFIHYPFVAFWKDHPVDVSVAHAIEEAGYELNVKQYASFFIPILMYVSLGSGISIMDEFQANTPCFNVKVYSLKDIFKSREYVIAHSLRQYISPATMKFIEFLLDKK